MGFSRQEYWSGLPCPPPGVLPDRGVEIASLSFLHWQMDSLPLASPRYDTPQNPRIFFADTLSLQELTSLDKIKYLLASLTTQVILCVDL